ncbi:MAG: adaptor protein MecA [bacterium]|nr:adaptor protein MecA [bacterium]
MTLWKLTEKHMNCMISEDEIIEMGFQLEELKVDKEKTSQFLSVILQNGKNLLGLDISEGMKNFNATYLQNNTVFLSISCEDPEQEINHSLDEMLKDMEEIKKITSTENVERIKGLQGEEKSKEFGSLVEQLKEAFQKHNQPMEQVDIQFDTLKDKQPLSYNIQFDTLDSVIEFSHMYYDHKALESSLFKEADTYYLMTDFGKGCKQKELRDFVMTAEEFGGHVNKNPYLRSMMEEHGNCIVKKNAIESLGKI